jgi:parallel beta-helix repeat protein
LIRDVDGEGIYLRDIEYSSITNNIVKGAGEYGLRLFDGADNNVIMGNVAEGTTGDLLYSSSLATNNAYGLNITPDLVGTAINGIRRDNVNTTPVSNVTPRYAGEFYYVTSGSKLFFAVGSTDTDWIILN